MKKFFLVIMVLSLVYATQAQTEYSVPAPTLEEKFDMTKLLLHNNVLALITVAKNEGMTPAELGRKSGEIFASFWEENGGFEPYVNFLLYAWACSAEDVRIIEQSDEKLVVMISSMYRTVEDEGVLFGSSVEDNVAFNQAMLNEIAVHLDRSLEMTWGEEGYRIEITK